MPNLLLTNFCNRSCPYCFALAQVQTGSASPQWEMPQADIDAVLSYLDPRLHPVSLLGGEPTLHSRFGRIVQDIADRGFDLKIFTNGTTPALRDAARIGDRVGLNIVLNLNPPETYSRDELREIEANCREFGPALRLSFNIHEPDFFWGHIKKAILDWGIGRHVRVGLTQPIRGADNVFLQERDLPRAAARITAMAEDLAAEGIGLGFDCGFRACAFTEEQRGILIECGTQVLFDCKPVLDVGPDLMVWRCFPFSTGRAVKLTDFSTLDELTAQFEAEWAEIHGQGHSRACASCLSFSGGACRGGCLSRMVARRDQEAAHA